MTGNASCGETLELSNRRALVTIVALHGCVGSQQWKAVLVILHLLDGNIPSLHRMTLRAIRAHLSLVHIGVTVLAVLAHIRENGFHMALRALHFFVHTAQGILGLVVIELKNRTDGLPPSGRMAVLTRNREPSVRASSGAALTLRQVSTASWPRKQQCPEHEFGVSRRICPRRHLPNKELFDSEIVMFL